MSCEHRCACWAERDVVVYDSINWQQVIAVIKGPWCRKKQDWQAGLVLPRKYPLWLERGVSEVMQTVNDMRKCRYCDRLLHREHDFCARNHWEG